MVKYRGRITLNHDDPLPPRFCPSCKTRLQKAGATSAWSVSHFYCTKCNATVTFDHATGQATMSRMEIERK